MQSIYDVVCIGGGIIGLMSAYELAQRGRRVAVLDRGPIGREASWAGAGILLPASVDGARTDRQRLHAFSVTQYPLLSERLATETGIDIGYRQTGALELELTVEANDHDAKIAAGHPRSGERIAYDQIAAIEPSLSSAVHRGVWIPQAAQVRNPRLLKALACACERLGVALLADRSVAFFHRSDGVLHSVESECGTRFQCGAAVVTAGAWSTKLLEDAGCRVPIFPVRGQIVAFQTAGDVVRHVILVGKRYLVPREDGLVLAGSTEELVDFDKRTTTEGINGLKRFASQLFEALSHVEVKATWAGLRPGCRLGRPIIGRVPGWANLWVAAGHFRSGIQLAIGTARVLADAMTGVESFVSLESFRACATRRQARIGRK